MWLTLLLTCLVSQITQVFTDIDYSVFFTNNNAPQNYNVQPRSENINYDCGTRRFLKQNNIFYCQANNTMSFRVATKYCARLRAYVVTLQNATEEQFLHVVFGVGPFWIGWLPRRGCYTPMDGSDMRYTNYKEPLPKVNRNCIAMTVNGWKLQHCNQPSGVICKKYKKFRNPWKIRTRKCTASLPKKSRRRRSYSSRRRPYSRRSAHNKIIRPSFIPVASTPIAYPWVPQTPTHYPPNVQQNQQIQYPSVQTQYPAPSPEVVRGNPEQCEHPPCHVTVGSTRSSSSLSHSSSNGDNQCQHPPCQVTIGSSHSLSSISHSSTNGQFVADNNNSSSQGVTFTNSHLSTSVSHSANNI